MNSTLKRMIKTFFRRWWITRQLHHYIYRLENTKSNFGGETLSRGQRVENGAPTAEFINWFLKHNTVGNFTQNEVGRILEECAATDIGYIEHSGNWVHVGEKGMEIYVWYYPIVAFFQLHYVRVVTTKLLEWGVPAFIVYLLARYLNITLNISG